VFNINFLAIIRDKILIKRKNPGSKVEKAKRLNLEIINENKFK